MHTISQTCRLKFKGSSNSDTIITVFPTDQFLTYDKYNIIIFIRYGYYDVGYYVLLCWWRFFYPIWSLMKFFRHLDIPSVYIST